MSSIRKTKSSPNILTAHTILFFCCFLTGILLANFRFTDEIFWLGYQTENAFRTLGAVNRTWKDFFVWTLKNRLLIWAALCVLSRIQYGNIILFAFTGWSALSLGFIFSSLTEQFSFAGITLCAAILFPHIFLYLLSCMLLIKSRAKRKCLPAIRYLPFTGIFLAGAISEYFLNPWFLQKMYSLTTLFSR